MLLEVEVTGREIRDALILAASTRKLLTIWVVPSSLDPARCSGNDLLGHVGHSRYRKYRQRIIFVVGGYALPLPERQSRITDSIARCWLALRYRYIPTVSTKAFSTTIGSLC